MNAPVCFENVYMSRRDQTASLFDGNMGLSRLSDWDITVPDIGVVGIADQVALVDVVKVATYSGPPGGVGLYTGIRLDCFSRKSVLGTQYVRLARDKRLGFTMITRR